MARLFVGATIRAQAKDVILVYGIIKCISFVISMGGFTDFVQKYQGYVILCIECAKGGV
jgi:hypothetical protein